MGGDEPSPAGPAGATRIASHTCSTSRPSTSGLVPDCIFLGLVVVLSFVLYAGKLGFYSDDWAYLGSLNSFGDFSHVGQSNEFDFGDHIFQRPTQAVLTWTLFRLFGLHPLGYHLANGLVLLCMTVFLYLVLRELRVPRIVAVSCTAVFTLYPGFSTDRFWFAAFGYPLSIATLFLSLYANLRALRSANHAWRWKLLAVVALFVSGLGYEVVLPLFLADIALLGYLAWTEGTRNGPGRSGARGAFRFIGPDVAALCIVIAYKVVTAAQSGVPADYPRYLLWLITGSIVMNFGAYGLRLPQAVAWSLRNVGWTTLAVGSGMAIGTFAYLVTVGRRQNASWPTRAGWGRLIAIGLVLFLLGYSIFLVNARILFTSTGINNRVSIAASLGVAVSIVGTFGLITVLTRLGGIWRAGIFAALVSLLCLSGFLITNALGRSWTEAWQRQQVVLEDIRAHAPRPEPGSVFILDGACPYVGPAIVFESNWDLAGALEVVFNDPTIRADVTSADLKVGSKGLSTTLYGTHHAYYPYGDHLFVYDFERATLTTLPDAHSALTYFAGRGVDSTSLCPTGWAGTGVPVLSADVRFRQLERTYFWGVGRRWK